MGARGRSLHLPVIQDGKREKYKWKAAVLMTSPFLFVG